MLNSNDEENGYVAFQVISQCDIKDIGVLLTLYEFGGKDDNQWIKHAVKQYHSLESNVPNLAMSPIESIYYLNNVNTDTEIIELFIELYVKEIVSYTKKLNSEVNIKLTKK